MLKALRYTVKTFVALMAILAFAFSLFFWRVSNGPVELSGYSPFLRNVLIEQNVGNNVSFEKSILTWRGSKDNPAGQSSFEIRFLNIEIKDPTTSTSLKIPSAGMQFSVAALFRGLIAPTFVEFSGLDINLLLPKETWSGEAFDQEVFIKAMQAYLDDFNNSTNLVPRLTRQMLSPPSPLNSTGYLQQLSLSETTIHLKDELSGDIWNIPDAVLDIKRIDEGLSLLLEGAIDFEDENDIPLHMSIQYNIDQKKATTQLRFSNFVPTNIAGEVEGLSSLASLNIPISGIIDFIIDDSLELPVIDYEFDVGEGIMNPADLYDVPIKVDEAALSGQIIPATDEISIENFYLKLDGTELTAEGYIQDINGDADVLITADVENMPLIKLKTYWPPGLLKGARSWIETNITGGMISSGSLDVNIRPEMWALDTLPDESFQFTFDVVGGTSHFLKPMPQLTNMLGSARLQLNNFLLKIDSGVVENTFIKNAVLNFNDISRKGEALAHFEIPISGRVEEVLRVIDHEPLGYPSLYGIKQDSILGKAEVLLTLDFPLIRGLKLKDVEFDVQADIEELDIEKLSDSLSLAQGTMSLSVNGEGITSSGNILLNGINFDAHWIEDFTKKSEFPTTYIIDGEVEKDEWDKLSLPFEPYLTGTTRANLILRGQGAGLKTGEGHFDLLDAEIKFEPLGWVKEKAKFAAADFKLRFDENQKIHVDEILFRSGNLNSDLQLTYDGEKASRLYIENLTMEGMDFSGLFEWDHESDLYQVSVKGDKFNAVPLMDIVLSPPVEGEEAALPDFNFAGSIANVLMYNDVVMKETTGLAGYIDNEVIDFGFNGNWGDDKNMSLIIASNDDPVEIQKRLTLKTNDAGQALRGLDFFTSGDQGELIIDAEMIKKEKGYSLVGIIEAKKFRVADSKVFSELLKEKEFAKAQDELEKNGLSFETFESNFEQYDQVLTLKSGSAKGPTLGVTMDGYIDQKFDEILLDGTIIPAYGINSIFSNIPLLGTILSGGKGEGVFSATYNVSGTIDEPVVKINSLMALAPGIFRKIFGALGSIGNRAPSAREEAEAAVENEKENLKKEQPITGTQEKKPQVDMLQIETPVVETSVPPQK